MQRATRFGKDADEAGIMPADRADCANRRDDEPEGATRRRRSEPSRDARAGRGFRFAAAASLPDAISSDASTHDAMRTSIVS